MSTEADRERRANDLYVRVVNPELTWWDDLPPDFQAGWLRGADYMAEAVAAERKRIRDAVEGKWLDPATSGWVPVATYSWNEALAAVLRIIDEVTP